VALECEDGQEVALMLLKQPTIDVSKRDVKGRLPLHIACFTGKYEVSVGIVLLYFST